MNSLETQLNAVLGFSAWLSEQRSSDLNASLLNVLGTYERELKRQLGNNPTDKDWYGVLALATIEAKFLRDELTEDSPALIEYRPVDEPRDTAQMKVRLLSDAIKLFDAACEGLNIRFELPSFAVEISESIERVITAGLRK